MSWLSVSVTLSHTSSLYFLLSACSPYFFSSPLPTLDLLPPTSLLFSHSPPLPSLLHTLLTPPTPPPSLSHFPLPPPPPPYSSPSFLHSFFSPEEKYGCEVRVIPVDFSEGQELYPRIAEELQDLDIGVLGKYHLLFSNSQPLVLLKLSFEINSLEINSQEINSREINSPEKFSRD